MSDLRNEMEVYDATQVSPVTGETLSYDERFFPDVIRKRERILFHRILRLQEPELILEYGCGGGWLSLTLLNWNYSVVGIDISKKMVKCAKRLCPANDYVVCDAMRLPFRDKVFDFTIAISVLHHLNLFHSLTELKRVAAIDSSFLFMEPNSLNPFSAFGRKFFPMEAHTKGEKPFFPSSFRHWLEVVDFEVTAYKGLFFFSFPLARFSKIVQLKPPSWLVNLTYYLESVFESIPLLNQTNSGIVFTGKVRG